MFQPIADLSLEFITPSININEDESFSTILQISNDGPDDATNIEVSIDNFPCASITNTSSTTGSFNTNTNSWSIENLSSQENALLTVFYDSNCPINTSQTVEIISSDQEDTDSNVNNNQASEDDQDILNILINELVVPDMIDLET